MKLSRRKWFKKNGLIIPVIVGGIVKPSLAQTVLINGFRYAAPAGGYSANATTFAGDGQAYMINTSGFGGSNGNTGIISIWMNPTANGTDEYAIYCTGGAVALVRQTDNKVHIYLKDSGGTTLVQANSNSTVTTGSWSHVIVAWDRATDNNVKFYVNGTSGTTISTFLSTAEDADPINYEAFQWHIGGLGIAEDWNGCLSEPWIGLGQHIDVDVQTNRDKWYLAGEPVDLGSDGSTPTGTAPRGYFKNAFSTFTVNSGTGGNFTKQGTTAFTSCTAP